MIKLNKKRWGKNFTDEEIAQARDNKRLLTLELETSHVCNLRCIYCYSEAGKKLSNELSFHELTSVVDQAKDLGARRIIVIGGGEPLMHPQIMELLEHIYKKGMTIDLFTNGTLVKLDTAKRLYDYGVQPVVKLNSLDPVIQDLLVMRKGTLKKMLRSIDCLFEAGYPDDDHDLGIESIVCSYNYDEIPALWRWARNRDIIPYIEMITFQGCAKNRKDLNVSVEDLKRLFIELSRIDREDYNFDWTPQPPIAGLKCSRLEYSCTVDARGYVQPCTGVNVHVGNIRHNSLVKIVQDSPVMCSLRHIRTNIKGACKACELLSQCYGCRGFAYHLTGDYLESDPLCWRNPNHINTVSMTRDE